MPSDTILIPDTPTISDLSFRHILGEQDADAIYALRAACVERDHVDRLSSSEGLPSRDEMRDALKHVVDAQQQQQRLVAQINDQVVGYSIVESWHENDGRWVYLILGWVLPQWRGRGIGTAMLHWGEQTARALAASQHPNEPFEFAANANSTQPESTALLLREGYHVGYTVLEMQLDNSALQPPQPLPAGIEIRPALPEHYPLIAASIGEAYRNEYAGGRFQEEWHLQDSITRLSAARQDPTLWQIAWAGDQVVGQVLPLIEKGRAHLHDVSVRSAWRRRGLARALLTRGLHRVRERGIEVIRLNTVAEFPTRAKDLYYSVGFRLMKEFPRYRKSP
jgi:ribosomal protein S18 acetylase RimI-like enzyme